MPQPHPTERFGLQSGDGRIGATLAASRRQENQQLGADSGHSYHALPTTDIDWPLAFVAKDKVVREIIDEDPDRWSQSSAGREYKMEVDFLRAPAREYPNQAAFSDRSVSKGGR
jgi:hypothetical protein